MHSISSPAFGGPPIGKTTTQHHHHHHHIFPHATVSGLQMTTTHHHHAITHSLPSDKIEVIKSLEPWVEQSILPFLKPTDESWQPSDFLPNSSQPFDQFATEVRTLRDQSAMLPDDYLVVLIGNMITEEALPTYETVLNNYDGIRDETGASASPWAKWTRGWAAEENRHGDLLHTYLYLSGRVNMRMIERTIQNLIASGTVSVCSQDPETENNPYLGFVYTSFQERATFVSHGNTARLAKEKGDPLLARICGIIASDEKRHEKAYIKIVEKLLEVDTTTTMLAIADMMQKRITMPAYLMNDGYDLSLFSHYSAVAQRLGVYTAADYADVLEFLVRRWRLEKLEGLTSDGQRAQEYVCGLAPRIRKLQERSHERAQKMEQDGVKFSWIFNKKVML
ncbi:hypothetical protein OSB04_006447 [Centaurea solstitialis]|uniref:Acyl-[acyl-carrier-protein] desaturase n=1 Tax=Centaurea solstitialis TaxID=347529 RepID=A0AA38WHP0_9ASTR|nr:hypothetical protein OSB04_006447 [Centaurea solstitialis]